MVTARRVYLAECVELSMLKIGTSYAPEQRVYGLGIPSSAPDWQRGKWRMLGHFPGDGRLERRIHDALHPFQHPAATGHHREWYRDCPQVRAAFDLLAAELT